MTERFLRIFRRIEKDEEPRAPRNGHIQVSDAFRLTRDARLALFYLHLLCTHPTRWKLGSTLWNGSIRLFDTEDEVTYKDL